MVSVSVPPGYDLLVCVVPWPMLPRRALIARTPNRNTFQKHVVAIRTLSGPSNSASIAAERHSLLLLRHVLEELLGALELPTVDRLGCLAGVLEGNTKVGSASASRLRGRNFVRSVPSLDGENTLSVSNHPAVIRIVNWVDAMGETGRFHHETSIDYRQSALSSKNIYWVVGEGNSPS